MIAIAIVVIVIFVVYSRWNDHVENGIKRIEGQIQRAEENKSPEEK